MPTTKKDVELTFDSVENFKRQQKHQSPAQVPYGKPDCRDPRAGHDKRRTPARKLAHEGNKLT